MQLAGTADFGGVVFNLTQEMIDALSRANKAVVGANAFAHASGIHQDGVLKARDTYEIMRAEDVGWAANKIVLGKLSGRNAFKQRLQELGIQLESEAEVNAAFQRFKDLADRKNEIFDEDIIALVMDESVTAEQEHFRLLSLAQRSETGERPHAAVVFAVGDGSGILGSVAIELEDGVALLRSLAVRAEHRGRGLGETLLEHALAEARRAGAAEAYLLTETAAPFFAARGWTPVRRDVVDSRFPRSEQVRHVCPSTAAPMRRDLQ